MLAFVSIASTVGAQVPEYEVYSAVIRAEVIAKGWAGHPDGTRRSIGRVVINRIQVPESANGVPAHVKARLPSLEQETSADFVGKAVVRRFESSFPDIGPVHLLTDAERKEIFGNRERDGWKVFYERFPDAPGLITLSQVGFNRAGTQALVRMAHRRGGLSGHVTFYVFRRGDAGWQMVERATVEISEDDRQARVAASLGFRVGGISGSRR